MATQTEVNLPIIGCLLKAEDMKEVGQNRAWMGENSQQNCIIQKLRKLRDLMDLLAPQELESIASWNVEEVNTFLRRKGFSIQLGLIDSTTFAVASVLDILLKWKIEATKIKIRPDKHFSDLQNTSVEDEVDGIAIKHDYCSHWHVEGHPYPITLLDTQSGDLVFITLPPKNDSHSPRGIYPILKHLSEKIPDHRYGGIEFPMIDLDHQPDIFWLIGMGTIGDDGQIWRISQALQQTKLRVNEIGARAQSAVATALSGFSDDNYIIAPNLIIDKPFLFWIMRPNLPEPLFIGYLDIDCWKEPRTLDAP